MHRSRPRIFAEQPPASLLKHLLKQHALQSFSSGFGCAQSAPIQSSAQVHFDIEQRPWPLQSFGHRSS